MALPMYFPEQYASDVTNFAPDPKGLLIIEELLMPFDDITGYVRYEVDAVYNSTFLCKQTDPSKRAVAILLVFCIVYLDDVMEGIFEKPDSKLVEGVLAFFKDSLAKNQP